MKTVRNAFALGCAAIAASSTWAYDIHLKSLTPVKELVRPAGAEMKFVENGELRFCVTLDPKAEMRASKTP